MAALRSSVQREAVNEPSRAGEKIEHTSFLASQLAFYGAYHHHKGNRAIHLVFVPALVWTAAVMIATVVPGAELLLLAGYGVFYLVLDLLAGASWILCIGLPCLWATYRLQEATPHACVISLGLHVLSWVIQVAVGHAMLEKRKPALLDSLVQSFALAPLFVWMEVLFLLGYKPKLEREVEQIVRKKISIMEEGKKR
mmetsp:Transcript_630/g.4249  ORF Transcript_630/g.4249 Transcript_630/m.4249 type:complete len:197 (+) Transcript_630:6586-7176(+)